MLEPSRPFSGQHERDVFVGAAELLESEALGNQFTHDGLLPLDQLIRIHDQKVKLRAHREVLFQNSALKDAKAFVRVSRKSQIHTRFEVFQLWPSIENAL